VHGSAWPEAPESATARTSCSHPLPADQEGNQGSSCPGRGLGAARTREGATITNCGQFWHQPTHVASGGPCAVGPAPSSSGSAAAGAGERWGGAVTRGSNADGGGPVDTHVDACGVRVSCASGVQRAVCSGSSGSRGFCGRVDGGYGDSQCIRRGGGDGVRACLGTAYHHGHSGASNSCSSGAAHESRVRDATSCESPADRLEVTGHRVRHCVGPGDRWQVTVCGVGAFQAQCTLWWGGELRGAWGVGSMGEGGGEGLGSCACWLTSCHDQP